MHSPIEGPDRPGQTFATRNHDVIRHWAEWRGGKPATVAGTEHGERAGVLRLTFGGGSGRLEEIGWDDWFKPFDERELVFVFQDTKRDGNQGTFFRLDSPEREDG